LPVVVFVRRHGQVDEASEAERVTGGLADLPGQEQPQRRHERDHGQRQSEYQPDRQ
jgi:hypothetical protein